MQLRLQLIWQVEERYKNRRKTENNLANTELKKNEQR